MKKKVEKNYIFIKPEFLIIFIEFKIVFTALRHSCTLPAFVFSQYIAVCAAVCIFDREITAKQTRFRLGNNWKHRDRLGAAGT